MICSNFICQITIDQLYTLIFELEGQNRHKTQKTNSYKKNTRHFHEVKLMETQVLVPAEKAIVCTTKALQAPKVIIIS